MHIGIISTVNGCMWAGSEETWLRLANHASAKGCRLSIQIGHTLLNNDRLNLLRLSGASIFPTYPLSGLTRRLSKKSFYNRFRILLKRKPDILFLSMGGIADVIWMPDLLGSILQTNIPVVLFPQANAEGMVASEWERESLRMLYLIPKSVIMLSKHNHELLERQLGMCIDQAVHVMNPIRDDVPTPLDWPDHMGCIHFAQVSRLELADKQQDHLLKALSLDRWRHRNWALTLYGSGPDESHIRRLIEFYRLADKVSLGGFVPDFQDIWSKNHIHILPSRREGMPLALIESMTCGRPAVVTRAGGSSELIEHNVTGWICPGMHPEVLSDTLEYAWHSRNKWQRMGELARTRVLSLQEPNWAARIFSILQEAASSEK